MPSDLVFKTTNLIHRGVQKISGGRVGWEGSGMPVLELTTIGRKSGVKRETPVKALRQMRSETISNVYPNQVVDLVKKSVFGR